MRSWRSEVIRSYRDLKEYKGSYDLAIQVYRVTQDMPGREQYETVRQIRRAATWIPMNIA